ncbi:ABC transporter permease [Ligilactobacillus pabuli]|uniref:ABC transporter permease n=1 Tax=Ligilactobacillus pabuli TaxID=2886039 RepID=A0ABQ5JMV1_9LACO|nr:ABC transporter permease [Ligilactobacillus pabuli]GKS81821.1 ABC transporter permease [Ligilactobacillus pabuli]
MKKTYLKSALRDIRFSLGRFIAIILIILMGVLLFVGVKSVGPDLTASAQHEIDQNQMSDLQIISTGGLTQADRKAVEKIGGVKVQLSKGFSYVEKKHHKNLHVYSYSAADKQNRLIVTAGHLPRTPKQIVVDDQLRSTYKLGSTLKITDDNLKNSRYQVVGFVNSPLFIANEERGNLEVGDGQANGFIYVPQKNFTQDAYAQMYLRFNSLAGQSYASAAYKRQLNQKITRLKPIFKQRQQARQAELQKLARQKSAPAQQKITEQQEKLTQAKQQLTAGQAQLKQAQANLQQQQQVLSAQIGEQAAKQQLAGSSQQLAAQVQSLQQQQKQLAEAQTKLTAGQAQLNKKTKIERPTYLTNKRTDLPGFTDYASLSDRIDAIANIFPVFFFFIAILITFTTMTRMITEDRRQIGTMLSLGYKKLEVSTKYLLYALLTALIGSVLGVLIGSKALPPVFFAMTGNMYIFQDFTAKFYPQLIWLASGAALLATVGSVVLVLVRDLREKPMNLLVEKAPKAGKRILLEKISFFWRRLGFTQKITVRNLFRYKSRMILTIFGIAGCTGLMLAGFGLNDSIPAPGTKQFTQVNRYQALVTLKNKQDKAVKQLLGDAKDVQSYLPVHLEQVTFRQKNASNQDASLYAVSSADKFSKYVPLLHPQKKTTQKLPQEGAVVSQRLAQAYGLKRGDDLHFEDQDGHEYRIKLAKTTENYVGHNVYLSTAYYKKVVGHQAETNSYLVRTKKQTGKQRTALADRLTKTGQVLNTTFTHDSQQKLEKSVKGMSSIVLIFIVLSGTLAFVVLYNLTNINISERQRELATFKVLGFYDKEVTMLIVRENMIFTVCGIVLGFGVGWLLNWFILIYASSNMMVFPVVIHWLGYVISALMTIVFSAIVMAVTHRKLRQIDMISALNSSE